MKVIPKFKDMRKNFLLLTILILSISIKAQELKIYFPFDNYEINEKQQKEIKDFLNSSLGFDIQLNGYADTIGSLNYNKILSQKRVETVNGIIKKTNPNITCSTQSFGETKSFDPNQVMNRKVELIAINSESAITPIYKEPQVFLINNSKDTIIICAEGSKINIPKGSFDLSNEQIINGEIELRVTEYYTLNDILKAQLTTTSNELTLETGGMLGYLGSFCATIIGVVCATDFGSNCAIF